MDAIAGVLSEVHMDTLYKIAIREGFCDVNINVVNASNDSNFMGFIFKVKIEGMKQNNEREQLQLFMKTSVERMRTKFHIYEMYSNEIFFYCTLSEIYTKLQHDEKIPFEKIMVFPKYYGSVENEFKECLVLEDLSIRDYQLYDKFKSITLDYAKAAVNNLAKFHALSFVLERRSPEFFEKFIKNRKGNMYTDYDSVERLKKQASMIVENAVKNCLNANHKDKVRSLCTDICENVKNYVRSNKHPTLCHGDYKGDNLLVQYTEKEITSMMIIDYQLIHYGSPLNDVMYFIFGATDKQFRIRYFSFIIEFYYKCLQDFVQLFSIDIFDVYPKTHYEADVVSHKKMGLLVAVNVLPYILVNKDQSPDLKNVNESAMQKAMRKPNEIYLSRYNELIEEFFESDTYLV